MPNKRLAFSNSTAIQQTTAAGVAFDGAFPNGTDAVDNGRGMYTFGDAPAHAGLFYWDNNEALICDQFHVDLRGSGNISLYLVSLDSAGSIIAGSDILIEQQTGVQFVALDKARFQTVLLPRQGLKLVTTAVGGQKQIAQAVASIERTYVR